MLATFNNVADDDLGIATSGKDNKNNWANLYFDRFQHEELSRQRLTDADSVQTGCNQRRWRRLWPGIGAKRAASRDCDCACCMYVLWAFHLIGISEIISNIASTTARNEENRKTTTTRCLKMRRLFDLIAMANVWGRV